MANNLVSSVSDQLLTKALDALTNCGGGSMVNRRIEL